MSQTYKVPVMPKMRVPGRSYEATTDERNDVTRKIKRIAEKPNRPYASVRKVLGAPQKPGRAKKKASK